MTEPSEHNTEPSGAPQTERVQQAVEAFVALHTGGAKPELAQFVASYEEVLRPQILSQCQEYLTFDDMLGHQEWSAEAAEEPQGRSFGDFLIQEELGRGGMGVVYRGFDPQLVRPVAIKMVVEKDGVSGLFFRGLVTKIVSNGCQGILFSVLWRLGQDYLNNNK